MQLKKLRKDFQSWVRYIESQAELRCDLDVLLKEKWRHKIVPRDQNQPPTVLDELEMQIAEEDYIRLHAFLLDNHLSLQSLAAFVFHAVLDAYGYGHVSVVAVFGEEEKVFPLVVDHQEEAEMPCLTALNNIEVLLSSPFVESAYLLGQGLFDAALLVSDHVISFPDHMHQFPLTTIVVDDGSHVNWSLSYVSEFFERKTMTGVLHVAREIVFQLLDDYRREPASPRILEQKPCFDSKPQPFKRVKDLELISKNQKQELLEFNQTDGNYPEKRRLNQLFEMSVERTPNFPAMRFRNETMSYAEVDRAAANIAFHLGLKGNNELIALYMDKSDKVVLAMLGIWKAGCAFLSIDPSYPPERINFMLQDSGAKRILANDHYKENLESIFLSLKTQCKIIIVEEALNIQCERRAFPNGKSTDLAYVTYTSGTTGVPKGVPKFHHNVVNSITDLSERYEMLEPGTERVALFAAYVFEPFIRQMLIALINNQTLVVLPDEVRKDPEGFPQFLKKERITYLNGTGSVIQHFQMKDLTELKRILLVGEELTVAGLRQLRSWFNGRIINEYAFTESAFVTAVKEFRPGQSERSDRSIGRPLRNVKWYVLSENLKQVPIGAIGELYIGGMGVAIGYLNRKDLTRERFLSNPFQTEEERKRNLNARIYKTGDLARVLPNGEFEYMGRSDFQLKLNGVRIEPGEIEAIAMQYPGVRKCVVMEQNRNSRRFLVGYFTVEDEHQVTEESLLGYLSQRLIQAMVPARMLQMDFIPVNINGKVDRGALPKVSFDAASKDTIDETTLALQEIWGKVLGIAKEHISPSDDFFRLGGQSILCILLAAEVRRELGRELAVDEIFKLRSLEKMVDYLKKQNLIECSANNQQTNEKTILLHANGLHQGLLYQSLKAKLSNDAYIMQSVYKYRYQLNPEMLKNAWKLALKKYPGLRVRFEWTEKPMQIIQNEVSLNWQYEDLSSKSKDEQEAKIASIMNSDRQKPYNLQQGPLFRVYLFEKGTDEFILIFSCHHVILDGWSLALLHDDIHRFYLQMQNGEEMTISEDTAYVDTQKYWADHLDDSTSYWLQQIQTIGERCDLSGLLKAEAKYKTDLRSYDNVLEHREKTVGIGVDTTAALKSMCLDHHFTLHSVLQFVWHQVLHAFGSGQSTVVGTVVSGRNLPINGIERSLGLFINTLPLIVQHNNSSKLCLVDKITEIQASVNAMNNRAIVELGRLRNGELKRGLFDTLLVLENYPQSAETKVINEKLKCEHSFDTDKVDYPMALVAREKDEELMLSLWYAGELFDDDKIDLVLNVAVDIFQQLESESIVDISFCPQSVLRKYDQWNKTEAAFNGTITLHGVFETAADKFPETVAVVFENTQLTYQELNRKANQLAHCLLKTASVKPNEIIALNLDKNELMIVAILAVWKTGAAYVPIDPSFPDDRTRFMLEDTEARIVLTNGRHAERLRPFTKSPVLSIEELDTEKEQISAPVTSVTNKDLAYAIYTSGTTGKPKAVLVEHHGVVNLRESLAKLFHLDPSHGKEAVLSFSNYVFDHFIEQMTDALLNGQTLVVLNDEMRSDQARLLKYISKNEVTYLSGTPSVLSLYDFTTATTLKRIDAIGEDFTEPVFNKIRDTFSGLIINGYGPTEVSITSHKRLYYPGETRRDKSIGFPMQNIKSYVLNESMKPVPIGGIGELYLGGVGVVRGYLKNPILTAERFIPNPFQSEDERKIGSNGRIYKTGDLVRWLPNGELEYLGRTDQQVKIRGHRIELGEIESILSSYPGISRSLIVVQEFGAKKHLVGFYLSTQQLEETALKQWMRSKLAKSVVPTRILQISDIPVTASGKLDVKALPTVSFSSERDYVSPSSDAEIKLSDLWAKVLDLSPDQISVHDDFFSLGGDSIRAITLTQAAKTVFGSGFSASAVFEFPTISEQAHYVQEMKQSDMVEPLVPNLDQGFAPVSLAQQRLLFIEEFEDGSSAYNIDFCLEMVNQESEQIKTALQQLVTRHPSLRTVFRKSQNGENMQVVLDAASGLLNIEEYVVSQQSQLDHLLTKEYIFNLRKDLPIKIALIRFGVGRIFLHLVFHHNCFDGWSWNIFRREFFQLLSGQHLEPLHATYRDFAIWQRQQLSGKRLSELSSFWKNYLIGSEPGCLPPDFTRPAQFDYNGREFEFHIDVETTEALKNMAQDCKGSLYSVLLAAFAIILETFSGQKDFVIGTPYANRAQPRFQNVIGFFSNLLALRIKIDRHSTLKDLIRSVSKAVIEAQIHNDLPFEELVRCVEADNDPSRNPVFQTIFTLQENWPEETLYKPFNNGITKTKFDVTVFLTKTSHGIDGNFTYASSIFNDDSAHQYVDVFLRTLSEFVRMRLNDPVEEIDLSSSIITPNIEETRNLRPVHKIFEEFVALQPEAIAVSFNARNVSYAELNKRADDLAEEIYARTTIVPSSIVALVLDKSVHTIEAILAVWKAGAAYVPIDPSFPDERIRFMLQDTKARLVITNSAYEKRLEDMTENVLVIEEPISQIAETSTRKREVSSNDLAYAIYTSGTTGNPKAVLVEHRNLLSFVEGVRTRLGLHEGDERVLFHSNYVFDFSIEQIVLSILSGNSLLIPPAELSYFDDRFYEILHPLTYLSGTPTQIHQINLSRLPNLRRVLVAGEPFQLHQFNKIKSSFSGTLFSAYGTTESTIYNTVERHETFENTIGLPMSNSVVYVLDEDRRPLPKGAIGELFIGGNAVSRGYHNQSELTNQRFQLNPFGNGLIYKTGDLVRLKLNGSIEYIRRSDMQIKINGLRIEPSEIELVLSSCDGIEQCAVIPRDGHLIGYYSTASDEALNNREMFDVLRGKLSSNMIPSHLVHVHGPLPMTITGKLDTKSLPDPTTQTNYISPRNRIEAVLCELWREATGNDEVGIDEDFFQNGGDSIKAMMLASSIQRQLNQPISVKKIFDYPTVREFAEKLVTSSYKKKKKEEVPVTGHCPLLPIQKWFFSLPLCNANYWNQTFAVKVPQLDPVKLQTAIRQLTEHHDAFRLRYRRSNAGEIEQFYTDAPDTNLNFLNISDPGAIQRLVEWQAKFDIENGPLWCIAYLSGFEDGSDRVWFAMHHLIVDTVSWQILVRDLEILYNGGDLGEKDGSFLEWVYALNDYKADNSEQQLWTDISKECGENAWDPRLRQRETEKFEVEAKLIDVDVLLTAVAVGLREVNGRDENFITIETHGRPPLEGGPETRDTVGWFTTMYPFKLWASDDFDQSMLITKNNRKRIPNQGISYGLLHGLESLPRISFNYLGVLADSPKAWSLDSKFCGISKGDGNEAANKSMLDITMYSVRGHLHVEVNSCIEGFDQFTPKLRAVLLDRFTGMKKNLEVSRFDPYILVNENGPTTLFVLPPGEGGAESYVGNIGKHLSPDVRLLLFNNIHLRSPMDSFHSLARYYLGHVKKLQPSGQPFNLMGWSFGGVLALEMARQLTNQEEKVENLILIDPYFDVRGMTEEIGVGAKDILDPINYHYQPNGLEGLSSCRITLQKAGKSNDVYRNQTQKQLFDHYHRSKYNGLDRIIPREIITLNVLEGETHHSWVRNKGLVQDICRMLDNLL